MTFTWTGNRGTITDEDITAIVADMKSGGLELTWLGVADYLGNRDPEGTLNINAAEFLERAKGLGL